MDRRVGAPVGDRIRTAVARRVGIDARALAAFRISLALLLLSDLLLRSRDVVAFYTDSGVLPRAALLERSPGLYRLSLHTISGAAWMQVLLFVVAIGLAIALLVGYRTTVVAVASWILLVSLHARNPLVLNGGDSILRRLLFWGLFLPLGERWSLDALRHEQSRRRIASVASAALLLQVIIVYTANAAFKLRSDSWTSGKAMRYALNLDQLTVFLGNVLADYPALLGVLDRIWLALLVSSGLLVLFTGRRRTLFVSLFAAMHVGMLLTMRLGIFPLVSIAGLLPFLPGTVWDRVESLGAATIASSRVRLARDGKWRDGKWRDRFESARSRHVPFGRRSAASSAIRRLKRRLASPVVASLLAAVLVWNAATLGYVAVPDSVNSVADPSEHRWDMFAEPRETDGWYVVPGRLESGGRIDALHRSPVRWDRPPDLSRTYPNVRWFAYLVELQRSSGAELRDHLGEHLCRRWNARRDDDLTALAIYYVEEPTRFDGPEQSRPVELARYACSSGRSPDS